MRKFFKFALLIAGFFMAFSALALNQPNVLVVNNHVNFPSKARVKGQWSNAVPGNTTENIPWAVVETLCKHKKVCVGQIFVFVKKKAVKAGVLKVNTETGRIRVLNDVNGFNITVNGIADVTLSKGTLFLG